MNGQGLPALSFLSAAEIAAYTKTFQGSVAPGSGGRIGGDAARAVLMQSRLPVSDLGRIWELSDLNKTGSLSLAEFVLAMFLAQSRIKGKALPDVLPPKIMAEVQAANSSAAGAQMTPMQMQMQMPAPMQHLNLQASATQMPMPVQMQMQTPMQMQMPTPAPTAGSMHMPVAQLQRQQSAMSSMTNMAMPAPAVIPSIDPSAPGALQEFEAAFPSLSPQGGNQSALSSVRQSFAQNMLGNRVSESQHRWAISTGEKAQYEAIFRRWDPGHRGVLKGEQAREVFAQSGLTQAELSRVWALADINNQGELNLDEFSVAMHLIFRRIAGAPLPDKLPLELVPRSSKDFMDSLADMKEQLMFKDIVGKKTPASPRTNTATPLRTHTSSALGGSSASGYASEATDDDESSGVYKSANRRRPNNSQRTRTGAETGTGTGTLSASASTATAESIEQLRRTVQQRKDELKRLRADSERQGKERAESRVTARWRVDDLKREIEDIHRSTPAYSQASSDGAGDHGAGDNEHARLLAKRKKLVASVNELVQRMPQLAAEYAKLADELADAKREIARQRDAKSPSTPAGNDMESRAARLVAQRMAALTGQTLDELDFAESGGRVKDELAQIERKHKEQRERVQTVSSNLERVQRAMRDLKVGGVSAAHSADMRKWEDGVGVASSEVRDLIERLKRIERIAAAPTPAASTTRSSAFSPVAPSYSQQTGSGVGTSASASPVVAADTAAAAAAASKPAGPTIAERLAKATTKQERDQILKEMAEERFRERQRALGLPDTEEEQPSASHPAAPVDYKPAATTANSATAASNPFAARVAEDDVHSESSSDEEWDRDESSDDEPIKDLSAQDDPFIYGFSPDARKGAVSPQSTVSFNTAFANPSGAATAAASTENNPFLGLLAAASANSALAAAGNSSGSMASAAAARPFEHQRLRALYPYAPEAGAQDEITLQPGDLLETRAIPSDLKSADVHADEGWTYGEVLRETAGDQGDGWEPSGQAGWFPKDYAEVLGGPGSRGWLRTRARFGTAKYDYKPNHEDELAVALGDRVRVVDGDVAENWWKVRILHPAAGVEKTEGMLPAIYIDLDK
ncbi:actin organization and endocytosis protein [Coemansia sp. Benny D115]|nr:actin organization and endocytosis protein [Coemansia sp. Benny D115]